MGDILFGVGGPSRLPRKIPVSTCPIGPPEEWPIVCSRTVEMWYHWHLDGVTATSGRSSAHRVPREHCPGCRVGLGLKYVAYVGCWDRIHAAWVVKQLTGEAVISCPALAYDSPVDLRGKILRWGRRRPHPKAPVWAKIVEPREPIADLPRAFDLAAAIRRLYDVSEPIAPRPPAEEEMIPLPPQRKEIH